MHADSADVSSTDILRRGVSPDFGTTGSGESVLRQCGIFLSSLVLAFSAFAAPVRQNEFPPVPKEALAKLKCAVGLPVSRGLVFVNGKYIELPYRVERYGTAIRINQIQVTGQLVDWGEFLKQQQGYRIDVVPYPPVKKMVEADVPVEIEEEVEVEVTEDEMDDLFGDEDDKKPKEGEKKAVQKIRKKVKRTEMRKQMVEKEFPSEKPPKRIVRFDGEFAHNLKVKGLLSKIDNERAQIEKRLRSGWIMCFGLRYPRAEGDQMSERLVTERLWSVDRDSDGLDRFLSAARTAGLAFLPEPVLQDMFRNKIDWPKLKRRATGQ